MESSEIYDLLILVDATYSMSNYLQSLQSSLPKIIALSELTNCFARTGLLAYRDYCDRTLLEWSGWLNHSASEDGEDPPDLISIAKSLDPIGGGDYPEAVKTGLAKAYQEMRSEATTIILLYTDAPPHSLANGSMTDEWSNLGKEKKALSDKSSYGGFGSEFADWVSASKILHSGDKTAQVFCILEPSMPWQYVGHYNYLSTMTRGACLYLKDSKPLSISEVTVEMLLAWMGAEKPGVLRSNTLAAALSRYISVKNIKDARNETDSVANPFFAATGSETDAKKRIKANITEIQLTPEILKKHLPKKKTPVQDFAKRYATDGAYKAIAVKHLEKLIHDDVSAVSLNPIFGSLWRAVCNDRTNEARDGLIQGFGLQVDRIKDADEKARMKSWLEESYDYTAEVIEAIESVPESLRFPCVLLDPTLAFIRALDDEDSEVEEDSRPITEFRRDELLEIGRSCDYKILRRLGRVLTRLTFVNSADELPAHIASTADADVPKIPMMLASKEYGRKFWRILLHIVVPGTMLAARPAALLAALSIRLGVQPLEKAADAEMLGWRNRWNDLEIPETWNVSCLSLLLDADQAYRKRIKNEQDIKPPTASLLKDDDRALFERLVEYKMLELNLNTTLTAKVGWTPEKTVIPIGPVVTCRSCNYPRSVTIMGKTGRCGHCLFDAYASPKNREECINIHVSKGDDETTKATWVECCVQTCRAQYVVYNSNALNVRPKCHYCRVGGNAGPAPTLECTQCLNCIIWPKEYRPSSMSADSFKCAACSADRTTIIEVETTARILSSENTTAWLVRNTDPKLKDAFTARSLFQIISNSSGPATFTKHITLFPLPSPPLTLRGKLIRNPTDLLTTLQSFISRRRTESLPCSLCFSNHRNNALLPACRRAGCAQRICAGCLRSWYGINGPGRILNTAALCCAFCRRAPAAKTLASYGMGVHAVGDLRRAVAERGEWVHAWCVECGYARRFVERVCARGAPAEVRGWVCEGCAEADEAATKKCPGCGAATQKAGGCNHITCPVRRCGKHWCWECEGVYGPSTIYDHMESAHGGFYQQGDELEYEEAED
ncbi:hypothetical protein AOQ84DRAFT_341604 [Glonium stellatum]|uniref:RING-type domain-containing protein n=1 Tax=Glonium stellatum TaxID=574774 RepID=A0A8E2EZ71_9PEZI|nr:hypothetical protein AOQ84DRAFT_341604 [Glonium stellatum]